ncbi:MAG: DUF3293 domain-containing protein [Bacteroidota bacterium]
MNYKELKILYLQTTYTAHTPKQIFNIRIDETNKAFQKWLSKNNIQTWTMMTAANPRSHALPEEKNVERNINFEQRLQREQLIYSRSEGIPDDLSWTTEVGFFILNIDLDFAKVLASSVEQNAIIFGRVGEPTELVWVN